MNAVILWLAAHPAYLAGAVTAVFAAQALAAYYLIAALERRTRGLRARVARSWRGPGLHRMPSPPPPMRARHPAVCGCEVCGLETLWRQPTVLPPHETTH